MRTVPDMFYLLPGWLPGAEVGGPRAVTGGVNRLPPVGLIDFSVGGGAGVAGAFSRAQAESTPMAMIAPMAAVTAVINL
jgi:hypothetical protein